MPASSKAQFRFMKMMEHRPKTAIKAGEISPTRAKEFTKSNTGKKSYANLADFTRLKKMLKKKSY